jgi:spermidine synthase
MLQTIIVPPSHATQSLTSTEHEYHEALVHPGMFAHPNPEYVAILGGGEGATLREVLKHKTIKQATMIEIDETLVNICREHLPDLSDCSKLEGRADNCFDDELTDLVYVDGRQWFVDRFGPTPTIEAEHKFDVLIVDALDPEDPSEISTNMYNDQNFVYSLVHSLTDQGVLVIQVGTAPNIHDPKADVGVFKQREVMFNLLEAMPEVKVMIVYEEAHCGFNEPHSFLVVGKSADIRNRWHAESDVVDYEIYDRIVLSANDDPESILVHFDGSTQHSYHAPPKAWETVYCRREPTPFECAYLHLDMDVDLHEYVIGDEEASSFRIESDGNEEDAMTSVFATKDIARGSYIMAEHMASSFMLTDRTLDGLKKTAAVPGTGKVRIIQDLMEYIEYYGHKSNAEGMGRNYVEVGASAFIRRAEENINVGRWVPSHPSGARPKYSPVYERHHLSFDVFLIATRDIKKGEELIRSAKLWEE